MPEPKRIQLAGFNVAVVIAGILFLYFSLGDGSAQQSLEPIEMQNKVNPNDAPPASLARLPGIGVIKANAIVEYRQQFQKSGRGGQAFSDCNDLDNVKGIGPKTVSNMCEYLRFEQWTNGL